jgi:hypothetical protein
MARLGDGASREELRVEECIVLAMQGRAGIDLKALSYAHVAGPVASPMHSGVDADGWRVDVAGGTSLFLKLYADDTRDFLDLDASFRAAGIAADAGLAPKLLWSAPPLGAGLWDYQGTAWRSAVFDDSCARGVVSHVSSALRTLHAGVSFGRARNVFETVESHVALATARTVRLPADFDWLLSNVRDIGQAIHAAGVDQQPCHGDLIASNLLIGPGDEVAFVDWDEACDSDPYWDLGMYMVEAFPFDPPALAMLEDYGGRADARLLARCRFYGIAGDLAWAVRSLILAHQTTRVEVEYFKYAQWRALRCRVAMHDPKFEQMLRTL